MNTNWNFRPLWRDPWVWAGAVVVGIGVLAAFWLAVTWVGQPASPLSAEALVTVIPAPTETPTSTASPTPAITATPVAPPPPAGGTIAIGVYVQIRGTGGDGLRLRTKPGLDAAILALAKENEVFKVVDGPHPADGYTWWRLQAPYDAQRGGWAVSNYLSVLPTPPAPTPTPAP